jgi:putative oxidoreductase
MEPLRNASRAVTPVGLTVLRVVVGVIMAVHGWMKVTDYSTWMQHVQQMSIPYPEFLGPISVAAELAGGIGLILGLLTPVAAFGVLCQMIVAIALVHAEHGLLAQNGGFEYPLTLAAVAFFFMLRGAGPVSLDHRIFSRRRPRIEEPRTRAMPRHPAPA